MARYTGLIYLAYVGNPTGSEQAGGRLIFRSVIETNNDPLTAVVRNITDDIHFVSVSVNTFKSLTGHLNDAARSLSLASVAYP